MKQLQSLKQRQVGLLQAVKRELLTEYLIMEWMEVTLRPHSKERSFKCNFKTKHQFSAWLGSGTGSISAGSRFQL